MKSICDTYMDSHWLKITSIIEEIILKDFSKPITLGLYIPVNVRFWFNELMDSI